MLLPRLTRKLPWGPLRTPDTSQKREVGGLRSSTQYVLRNQPKREAALRVGIFCSGLLLDLSPRPARAQEGGGRGGIRDGHPEAERFCLAGHSLA